jgi:lipid-A-disaccharide synthase-like uncharacterized protein
MIQLVLPALTSKALWIAIGFIGQSLFFMRFFVQWIASERAGKSVVPVSFWYFSILGGLVLFIYALWRQDPVFIFGQSTGLLIYARNLYFIHRKTAPAGA